MTTYSSLPNKLASAVNGIDHAYRDAGEGPVPLVLLQHFRGNLDNWDPALIDALASTRRVVAFDNAGVGGYGGTTPHVIEQMAHDAIAFLAALEFGQADILGYFVAQEIALIRPDLVRRLILASPPSAARHRRYSPLCPGCALWLLTKAQVSRTIDYSSGTGPGRGPGGAGQQAPSADCR